MGHYPEVDALSAGIDFNSAETIRELTEWADLIIFMRPVFKNQWEKICGESLLKNTPTEVCDVGVDRFNSFNHPDLAHKIRVFADNHLAFTYALKPIRKQYFVEPNKIRRIES